MVFFFHRIWVNNVLPWYEERVYTDARIEGLWVCEVDYDGEKHKEKWLLKRSGHLVGGKISVLEGQDSGKTYDIKGEFRNLILTASYNSSNLSALDRGTINLMLINNGGTLKGYSTYYDDATHTIKTVCDEWRREAA